MTKTITRDRPAQEPGGLECSRCGCIFIGEPWHKFCAVCAHEVALELRAIQMTGSTTKPEKP